ncbi:MAG TPA: CsbD family protein [Castellaniella sp.]|nr:CsbD family protein [Castellaniella sp.]
MNNDIIAGKWKQLTGKAKGMWGEISDDELLRTEGNAERLAGLIQERYGKTKDEANKEVQDFFDQNR